MTMAVAVVDSKLDCEGKNISKNLLIGERANLNQI